MRPPNSSAAIADSAGSASDPKSGAIEMYANIVRRLCASNSSAKIKSPDAYIAFVLTAIFPYKNKRTKRMITFALARPTEISIMVSKDDPLFANKVDLKWLFNSFSKLVRSKKIELLQMIYSQIRLLQFYAG
jgi:hypothetical protein